MDTLTQAKSCFKEFDDPGVNEHNVPSLDVI